MNQPSAKTQGAQQQPFLAIDLDGTLHSGDLASEVAKRLILFRPWNIFGLLAHSLRGRLELKLWLARKGSIDMSRLDWNTELISFVKEEAQKGRKILLATAAVQSLAQAAANHLEQKWNVSVDQVLCSTEKINMLGDTKAEAIASAAGDGGFDYVGDSPTQDPPVFNRARTSHFVDPTKEMLDNHATADSKVYYTRADKSRGLLRYLLTLAQAKPRR